MNIRMVYLISGLVCRMDTAGATFRKRCFLPFCSFWEEVLDLILLLTDSMSISNNFNRSLYMIWRSTSIRILQCDRHSMVNQTC